MSGEVAAGLPFTVRIDRTPPAVGVVTPGPIADGARPAVELAFSDALSGTASIAVQVDGVGLPVSLPSPGACHGTPRCGRSPTERTRCRGR